MTYRAVGSLPCYVMRLIDEIRDAESLEDVDPEVFCPCKFVRDAAPNAMPVAGASCGGGGR
jgi:hypothetical protein